MTFSESRPALPPYSIFVAFYFLFCKYIYMDMFLRGWWQMSKACCFILTSDTRSVIPGYFSSWPELASCTGIWSGAYSEGSLTVTDAEKVAGRKAVACWWNMTICKMQSMWNRHKYFTNLHAAVSAFVVLEQSHISQALPQSKKTTKKSKTSWTFSSWRGGFCK